MLRLLSIIAFGCVLSGCAAQNDLDVAIPKHRVAAIVAEEAKQQGVPVNVALAVAETESRFDPHARSPAGAMGVMQVMPGTWRGMGCAGSPWNAEHNVKCGVAVLARHLKEGSVHWAVAAYHGGAGGAQGRQSQQYMRLVMQRAGLMQREFQIATRD